MRNLEVVSEDKCPKCGSSNIGYGVADIDDLQVSYPCICHDCNTTSSIIYDLVYNHSTFKVNDFELTKDEVNRIEVKLTENDLTFLLDNKFEKIEIVKHEFKDVKTDDTAMGVYLKELNLFHTDKESFLQLYGYTII